MNPIKIYIVDDHNLFIKGLYSLLSDEKSIELIGYCTSPLEFIEQINKINADVFLIDINMPKMTGISVTQLLLEQRPSAKILALTMYDDYRHIENMFKSGATGYSLKSDTIPELLAAIHSVAKKQKFVSRNIQQTIIDQIGSIHELEDVEDATKSKFTRREIEIVRLIIKEYSNKEIAEKLFISPRTVESHRKNIYAKANTNSAMGLLKYAVQQGIADI